MYIIKLEEAMIETPDYFYMILEHCNRGNLAEYLKEKAPLSESEAR